MTMLICETAVLADAVQKAARVAPSKGAAFDKAQGVMLEVRPDKPSPLYVKASDLEVTYLQRVPVVSVEGDDMNWRFPSALFAGIMSSLPMGAGQNVTLTSIDGNIEILAGKKRAVIRLIASDVFPTIKPFDPAGMATVDDLARRVEQAAWSTDNDSPVLCGIRIDGENVAGCDRTNLVMAPCKVPIDASITVPLRTVAPLLRNIGPVQMRATDYRLELMPDGDTQITSILLSGAYPKVELIKREEFSGSFHVSRDVLIEAINGMLVLVRGERYPYLHIHLEPNVMSLDMEVSETGKMQDSIEIDGGDSFDLWVTPQNIMNAVSHANRDNVEIHYGPTNMQPIRVTDGDGYEFWGMPLRPPPAAP